MEFVTKPSTYRWDRSLRLTWWVTMYFWNPAQTMHLPDALIKPRDLRRVIVRYRYHWWDWKKQPPTRSVRLHLIFYYRILISIKRIQHTTTGHQRLSAGVLNGVSSMPTIKLSLTSVAMNHNWWPNWLRSILITVIQWAHWGATDQKVWIMWRYCWKLKVFERVRIDSLAWI